MRLDFGKNGYSMTTLPTRSYWDIYSDEHGKKRGKLGGSVNCRGNIDVLIEIISVHVFEYDLTSNNCKHFVEQIWNEMIMPKREGVNL